MTRRFNKYLLVMGVLLTLPGLLLARSHASENPETQVIIAKTGDVSLNEHWHYFETAVTSPNALDDSVEAVDVNLPHTWNAFDPTDSEPGYRRDASWYRKQIQLQDATGAERFLLYFEGANMTADVYVNGQRAGGHVGGYLGFEMDITSLLDLEGSNDIRVRVDNGINRQIIPSQKADFVLYGGLTRDVFLRIRPSQYVASIQIDSKKVSRDAASVSTTIGIKQHTKANQAMTLVLEAMDPAGKLVSSVRSKLDSDSEHSRVELDLPVITGPALWSPATPNLYTMQVSLVDEEGRLVHQDSDRFGLRWFEFNQQGGFELNGERLLLRGTHRHEEHAGLGAAMPNEMHVRDMQMIKDIGANFVRLGHYPQDPAVYEAADELGLIIWDELPWCRGGLGDDTWKQTTESMLREMITQNRNHASIFFWSLGNEIYWEPDFEGGGEEGPMNEYLAYLNDIAHEMDPSRLTSIRKYYAGSDIVDVFSPSIWAGWYGGGYHQYEAALIDAQKKYPALLHMEYGGSSHVGRNNDHPPGGDGLQGGQTSVAEMVNQTGVISVAKGGDWSESYIVDLFDWHLKVSESLPNFGGNAQWAFKDFSTPLRPENPLPFINQKGLVDRQGRPKEAYWVFKSYWTTDPAFCHIYGHSWTERHGEKGDSQQIRVYCNTESAQLTLNSVDLDKKQKNPEQFPASGLYWDVTLQEGLNRLEVTGYSGKEAVTSEQLDIYYTEAKFGKLANIELTSKPLDNGLIQIVATAVDNNGQRIQSADDRVYFSHVNKGTGGVLLEAYGTPDRSSIIELANGRATILFKPANDGGTAVIEVRSQTFKGSYLYLDAGTSDAVAK